MIHFLIEILSHASLFLIFLTGFYVTYVGYIQEHSMVTEFGLLLQQSIQTMGITLPPQLLAGLADGLAASPQYVQPVLNQLVADETNQNKQLLTPVFFGVLIASSVGLATSLVLAYLVDMSIPLLLAENLIALTFIAVTDIIITTLYGNFRTLDSQYLLGIFSQRASGMALKCTVVEDTLDAMFPIPFIQSIIRSLL